MKKVVLALCLVLVTRLCPAQAIPTNPPIQEYRVVFVSDLHMGVGRDPERPKQWHATEDFRWHQEFGDFLRSMDESGKSDVELVILGDFLELWQSLSEDCDHQKLGRDLGCREDEALNRARRVLSQHAETFTHLSWFAGKDKNNKISIVPGNHDVALAFPSVRQELMENFDKSARPRVTIEPRGLWISGDGRIVAEHGQQIGADPNKFQGWPFTPYTERGGVKYLVQPWGEHLVQSLFNDVENRFPIIDNLSEEILGAKYASKSSTWRERLAGVAQALRFILTQTSWDQTKQLLGRDGVPEWDIPKISSTLSTPETRWEFLVASLAPDDELRVALNQVESPPGVPPFTNEEIEAICDRRWALAAADPAATLVLCASTGKLGAVSERISDIVNPAARNQRFREYFTKDLSDRLRTGNLASGFSTYVFGHTHKVEVDYRPYGDAPTGIRVYNDGAWQRTATPEQLCTIAKKEKWKDEEVLVKGRPEHLPACYPFVTATLEKDSTEVNIMLLYWNQKPGQKGNWDPICTAALPVHDDCEPKRTK